MFLCRVKEKLMVQFDLVLFFCFFFVLFVILQEKLESVVFSSKAYETNAKRVEQLWGDCGDMMYSLTPKCRQLGLGEQVSDMF